MSTKYRVIIWDRYTETIVEAFQPMEYEEAKTLLKSVSNTLNHIDYIADVEKVEEEEEDAS